MRKIFLLVLLVFQFGLGQENTLSALQAKLDREKDESKKLEIINEMMTIAFADNITQALVYAKHGVAISEKCNDKNWLPKFYESQGRMHANLLQLDSADLFFNKAIKGYKTIGDQKGQASTLFKMGWVLKKKGEYEKALQKDLSALRLMESVDDKAGICDAMTRVSEDLNRQERFKESLDYALKSIAIAEKYKLEEEKYYCYFNAGYVAISNDKHEAALDYFNKAYAIAEKRGIGLVESVDLSNALGNAYKKLGRYSEALTQFKKGVDAAKQSGYSGGRACIANIAETYMLMGDNRQALPYILENIRQQKEVSDFANLVENLQNASLVYEKLGNYQSALLYRKEASVLRDSLSSAESDAKMSEMLTKYETDKKEATITSQQNKISQQKTVQWLGIGVVALLIGLIVFGYISYTNRTKTNRLLSAKNAENELLLKEIHHRVKNNLEIVSSLLALQSAQIDDPNTKEAMTEGQNRVNSIGIVHQKLYQGTNLGSIEIKDYFHNLGESILDSFGAAHRLNLQLAMQPLELDIDTAVPLGLIINELLTNAVKYAFPSGENGTVIIQLEKTENLLHLEVSDNGVGKSGITHGTGFGGQLVALLTHQLNGTMTEDNQNGTRLVFDFKLKKPTSVAR